MNDIEWYERICKERPEFCQRMADEGIIYSKRIIKNCLKLGIVFKEEVLQEMGIDGSED